MSKHHIEDVEWFTTPGKEIVGYSDGDLFAGKPCDPAAFLRLTLEDSRRPWNLVVSAI